MPWTPEDMKTKSKDLTDVGAAAAAKVANKSLTACLAKGGKKDECEATAIMQGIAVGKQAQKTGGNAKEGMLADEVKAEAEVRELDDLIWKASDLIRKVARDITLKTEAKKTKIGGILDDLEKEIGKRPKALEAMTKKAKTAEIY